MNEISWQKLWNERGIAIARAFGQPTPPSLVHSFDFGKRILPGACGLYFPAADASRAPTYITMGPSQVADTVEECERIELCVHAAAGQFWPYLILHDLLTQWVYDRSSVRVGSVFPFVMFRSGNGEMTVAIGHPTNNIERIGVLEWMLLWPDSEVPSITVRETAISVLAATPITNDEKNLASIATVAHLMLALKLTGVLRQTELLRRSMCEDPRWTDIWHHILELEPEECERRFNDGH